MFERFSAHNFRALAEVDFELEPITVLLGPNAVGKSSVLDGLYYLSQLARKQPKAVLSEFTSSANQQTRGSEGMLGLRAWGRNGQPWSIELLWCDDDPTLGELNWSYGHEEPHHINAAPGSQSLRFQAKELCQAIGNAVFLRLEPSSLAAPAYSPDESPRLASDGTGLAAVLDYYRGSHSDCWDNVEQALREVVPQVKRIRLERATVFREETRTLRDETTGESVEQKHRARYGGHRLVVDMQSGDSIPAELLSEGTLITLGMLTAVLGPTHPNLVLIDDIERGLHPTATKELVNNLRSAIETHGFQIVATSHSPYLVDSLTAKEVRVMTSDAAGLATVLPLAQHPDYERLKGSLETGEFWSAVGEAWVADGQR